MRTMWWELPVSLSEHDRREREPATAPAPTPVAEPAACTSCAGGRLAAEKVKAAFWEGERLVVVDDIPALVCQDCGERYYEDETAMRLDFLRGTGFPPDKAARTMSVPVFHFDASDSGQAGG